MTDNLERLRAALQGKYSVERQIGQGGMATVYLAEDVKHRRQVAIKVLLPELVATLGSERFLREIELAARLQHPHIVPLYDSGSADGFLYYVMPFIEGESLRDLIKREGRLPMARAAAIAREAASGLAYAHKQGIVHRDVKPENIMLSGGHAVVADFGIARAVDASRNTSAGLTGVGIAIGTPAYMSPEQATADTVDGRTDQYALACVFYEMVTGKQPFSGPTMQALLTQVLTAPRPKLSTVLNRTPPLIDAAVQKALDQNPEKRFADITGFTDALMQESSGAAAATREGRKWKRLAMVMAAVVVLIVAAWLAWPGPKREVVSGAETIAVVPFTASGPNVESLGEGMVDLIGGNLDGVGGIRTIESRQVLRAWQKRAKGGTPSLDDAIAVAKSVNAASVLTGSIVATGGSARLSAELYDLTGKQLAREQVDGPSDSVMTLADALALKVLHAIWRSKEPMPSGHASAITSTSVEAIRAYLEGEKWHRRGQWDSAQIAFERAVAADSTFALAWYQLANTMGWIGSIQDPRGMQAGANALKYSGTLPARVRRIIVAYDLFEHGKPAAADSMQAYVAQYPTDADAWYLLGEAQFHTRAFRTLSPAELSAPFDKVLALDSTLTPAAIHPMELALSALDTALALKYLRVFKAANAEREARRSEAALAIARGTKTGLDTLFAKIGLSSEATAVISGRAMAPTGSGQETEQLLMAFITQAKDPAKHAQALLGLGMAEAGLGRQSTALKIADSLKALQPQLADAVKIIPVQAGFATRGAIDSMWAGLEHAPPTSPFVLYWQALLALDRGEPAKAAAPIQAALAMPATITPTWLHGALIGLDGLRMVALGDSVRGIARADSGLKQFEALTNPFMSSGVGLRLAMLLVARPATREEGIRRLRYSFADQISLQPILQYDLGKAYEASGNKAGAIAAYGQFLRLWDKADPGYQPRIKDAKDALQRLTAEGAK